MRKNPFPKVLSSRVVYLLESYLSRSPLRAIPVPEARYLLTVKGKNYHYEGPYPCLERCTKPSSNYSILDEVAMAFLSLKKFQQAILREYFLQLYGDTKAWELLREKVERFNKIHKLAWLDLAKNLEPRLRDLRS